MDGSGVMGGSGLEGGAGVVAGRDVLEGRWGTTALGIDGLGDAGGTTESLVAAGVGGGEALDSAS